MEKELKNGVRQTFYLRPDVLDYLDSEIKGLSRFDLFRDSISIASLINKSQIKMSVGLIVAIRLKRFEILNFYHDDDGFLTASIKDEYLYGESADKEIISEFEYIKSLKTIKGID